MYTPNTYVFLMYCYGDYIVKTTYITLRKNEGLRQGKKKDLNK